MSRIPPNNYDRNVRRRTGSPPRNDCGYSQVPHGHGHNDRSRWNDRSPGREQRDSYHRDSYHRDIYHRDSYHRDRYHHDSYQRDNQGDRNGRWLHDGPGQHDRSFAPSFVDGRDRGDHKQTGLRASSHRANNPILKPFQVECDYKRDIQKLRNLLLRRDIEAGKFEYERYDLDDKNDFSSVPVEKVEEMERSAERPSPQERDLNVDGALDVDLEIFFSEFLSWSVLPTFNKGHPDVSLLYHDDHSWLFEFLSRNEGLILKEMRFCKTSEAYASHWKLLLYMELHYTLKEEIQKTFPVLRSDMKTYVAKIEDARQDFVSTTIKKVRSGRLVLNIVCNSVDPRLTVMVKESMKGMVIAMGHFRRYDRNDKKVDSPVQLMLIRSVHVERDESLVDGSLAAMDLRIVVHRAGLEEYKPRKHEFLYLAPLMQFSSIHRSFRAVHEMVHCPFRVKRHMFGDLVPQPPGTVPSYTRSPRKPTSTSGDQKELLEYIDEGSKKYIQLIRSKNFLNGPQIAGLKTVMAEIGGFRPRSGSISMIHGPPGTGKTRAIVGLIGCLLNSSKFGHLGNEKQTKGLKKYGVKVVLEDTGSRVENNEVPVRILVCAPSNPAVDRVCREVINTGIYNNENGGNVVPGILRIGKDQHEYGDLAEYSLQYQVDQELKSREDSGQDKASGEASGDAKKDPHAASDGNSLSDEGEGLSKSAAVRNVVAKTLVFFATNSTAGSGHFKSLNTRCNVIIVDEAANCSEPDVLVPICTVSKSSDLVHAVLVGDHKQLGTVARSKVALKTVAKEYGGFNFIIEKLYQSFFQRLMIENGAASTMLTMQLRTHPHIGRIHSFPFYGSVVVHPAVQESHLSFYNSRSRLEDSFMPLSIIDTRLCLSRVEDNSGGLGSFVNCFEADVVNRTLCQLKELMITAQKDGRKERLEISVLSPYRAQVELLEKFLCQPGRFLEKKAAELDISVNITTIDNLQGSESDVVIISFVRSNKERNVGFLTDRRRLNVATSRARKLLVMIGDSSTLVSCKELQPFWRAAVKNAPGTSLTFIEPSQESDKDICTEEIVKDMKDGKVASFVL